MAILQHNPPNPNEVRHAVLVYIKGCLVSSNFHFSDSQTKDFQLSGYMV